MCTHFKVCDGVRFPNVMPVFRLQKVYEFVVERIRKQSCLLVHLPSSFSSLRALLVYFGAQQPVYCCSSVCEPLGEVLPIERLLDHCQSLLRV